MSNPLIFVFGTGTGVGKTWFTAALTAYLRAQDHRVVALKPLASGDRVDAIKLREAAGGVEPLDVVNPWHFRAPLTPLVAARKERRRVQAREVQEYLLAMQERFSLTLVEGAGGLLSPLGEDFDGRDLLVSLRGAMILVGINRLGILNLCRLSCAAVPVSTPVLLALVDPPEGDGSALSNVTLLREMLPGKTIVRLPRLDASESVRRRSPRLQRALREVGAWVENLRPDPRPLREQ